MVLLLRKIASIRNVVATSKVFMGTTMRLENAADGGNNDELHKLLQAEEHPLGR